MQQETKQALTDLPQFLNFILTELNDKDFYSWKSIELNHFCMLEMIKIRARISFYTGKCSHNNAYDYIAGHNKNPSRDPTSSINVFNSIIVWCRS